MNTKKKGTYKFIMFQEGDGDYCAVCLTLNLVEWGKDPDELLASINEAAESYILGVVKNDFPDEVLNRSAPEKYWNMAKKNYPLVYKTKEKKPTGSDFFTFSSKPYSYGSFVTA